MNWKVTLLMIFAVLLMMLGAGGASAYISYLMGREALKVVTQPDTDSEHTIDRKKPLGGSHKGLKIIEERTVLINVYNHIHQEQNPLDSNKSKSVAVEVNPNTDNLIQPDKFPLKNESGGVSLEITQAILQGNSVILDVNLKNDSSEAVRFLYSFLDVRDEKNRPLSAIADGLPGELPPKSENFAGKLIIPVSLLENSQNISLSLQDYPEQKLTLQFPAVPVAKEK